MSEIGGFLQGFGQSFGQAREQRRLRDVFEAQQAQAQRQEAFQERQFGLQEERFGLEQEEFGFRQEQAGFQRQVQERQQEIQEKQLELQKRNADVQALSTFTKLNQIPKAARPLFLKQLAPQMGIDPESQEFKDVVSTLGKLSPEELQQVTSQFTEIFPTLPPGQAAAFARGVVSGQITLSDAMDQARQAQTIARRGGGGGGPQPAGAPQPGAAQAPDSRLLDPTAIAQQPAGGAQQPATQPTPGQAATPEQLRQKALELTTEAENLTRAGDEAGATRFEAQARNLSSIADEMEQGAAARQEFDPAAVEERAFAEATGEGRAQERVRRQKPISPALGDLLGVQGAGKLTTGEAEDLGIFTDIVGADELKGLRETKNATKQTISQIDNLTDTVRGRDELLGFVGGMARGIDAMVSQALAVPKLVGHIAGGRMQAFRNSPEMRTILGEHGLAATSKIVQSRITDLAFQLAKSVESGRLSDQDISRALAQLGESPSADQFVATLGDLRERVRSGTLSDIESATGMRPLDLMNPDELIQLSEETEDPRILRAILLDLNKRGRR